ncbi:N-6 DNA methylase [Alkaliphilus transvaalensis]
MLFEIEAGIDCTVAMPDKLFYSTGVPVSLWILNTLSIVLLYF